MRRLFWGVLLVICVWFEAVAVETTTVQTRQGGVSGALNNGVHSFKGIPYAAPPVGKWRWELPQPAPKHQNTFDATEFGPACLQPLRADDLLETSEDCLTLNVWTAEVGPGEKPVMVWIHGGGFRWGSGRIPGEVFVHEGAVVVSLNYRLGPLGIFAHDSIDSETANFALLDLVQGLQWVRDNISSFGGDPSNVTIFGVSAGGMAVNLLMATETAAGLFHQAIAQSGYTTWPLSRSRSAPDKELLNWALQPVESAESFASAMVAEISDKPQTAENLRALDGETLVAVPSGFILPIVDGHSLKEEPAILFDRGQQHKVPYLTGGNSYEGSVMPGAAIAEEELVAWFGAQFAAVKNRYAADFSVSGSLGIKRMFGDLRYVLAARVSATAVSSQVPSTYVYYVDFVPTSQRGNWPGTLHGADAGFMWRGTSEEDAALRALSKRMRRYWFNFAENGNPNRDDLLNWPSYQRDDDRWLVFAEEDRVETAVITDRLDVLESRYRQRIDGASAHTD